MKEKLQPNHETKVTIRGLDPVLWAQVRIICIQKHINAGEWVSQAIQEKLAKEETKRIT